MRNAQRIACTLSCRQQIHVRVHFKVFLPRAVSDVVQPILCVCVSFGAIRRLNIYRLRLNTPTSQLSARCIGVLVYNAGDQWRLLEISTVGVIEGAKPKSWGAKSVTPPLSHYTTKRDNRWGNLQSGGRAPPWRPW